MIYIQLDIKKQTCLAEKISTEIFYCHIMRVKANEGKDIKRRN